MNLLTLYTDTDFADAVVPAGMLLIFFSVDSNGKVSKRYKDENGNYGSL